MKMTRIIPMRSLKLQKGMTLVELLVAGTISLIAVSGMVLVMASTLGTTTQTIEMTHLTHDMRTAMQIMTRELRRANYHPTWLACYGNMGCRTELGITTQVNSINIGNTGFGTDPGSGTDDCVWFWYDRPQICPTASCDAAALLAAQTPIAGESVSAFRRAETAGVGRLQMTTTRTVAASCSLSADWVDITDPNIIDVLAFFVTDADVLSPVDLRLPSIEEDIGTAGAKQFVEKIGLRIRARLTFDPSVPAWIRGDNATRTMDEFIRVRNNITTAAP